MSNLMESTYAYARQRERLQGMLLMANGDDIMETRSNLPLTAASQLVKIA